MKPWLLGALVVALVATSVPTTVDAKRIGGGKSSGLQRSMPARTAPDAPPPKPATPAQGQQAAPANAANAAPAAAPRRNWMGPLAGLAAGLGIAALLSHFGLGEGAANFLMMALLAVGAFFLIRFLLRRFAGGAGRTPALAGAGAGAGPGSVGGLGSIFGGNNGGMGRTSTSGPRPLQPSDTLGRTALDTSPANATGTGVVGSTPVAAPAGGALAPAPVVAGQDTGVTRAFVPASFDADGFTRTAKMIFIRLQAANDTADLDDLRRFTTPELFASLRLDIQERGPSAQHTDVVRVEAEVLDVADESDRQVVSVRFHGEIVEEKDAAPVAFNEVWHLAKPHDDSRAWAIAGIEQMA